LIVSALIASAFLGTGLNADFGVENSLSLIELIRLLRNLISPRPWKRILAPQTGRKTRKNDTTQHDSPHPTLPTTPRRKLKPERGGPGKVPGGVFKLF
jgi:hypothetical protein